MQTWSLIAHGITTNPNDLAGGSGPAAYRIRVEARWLDAVLTGRIGWEDLLLSLRISAWREPDRYNDYLVGLLKHADAAALQAVEHYETSRNEDETVVLRSAGRQWEVSRYCPHAGEDLTHGAVVTNGVLRCLGHNFDFDLETGQCLNARCAPIVSRKVTGDGGSALADSDRQELTPTSRP